jgi:hypothetical protein
MKIPWVGLKVSSGALALGAIGVMVAPKVIPVVANFLKTATKTGMKGGMIAYDKGRELVSGTRDAIGDMASEARSEMSKGSKSAGKKKAAA